MDGVVAYTVVLARLLNRDVHADLLVSVVSTLTVSDGPLDAADCVGAVQVLHGVLRTSLDFLQKPIARQENVHLMYCYSCEQKTLLPFFQCT